MKRVLLGLLVLLVAGLAAVYLSIDRIAGHAIETNATRALGVDTRVGFVRLSPFAGELKVSSLSIDNPPGLAVPMKTGVIPCRRNSRETERTSSPDKTPVSILPFPANAR